MSGSNFIDMTNQKFPHFVVIKRIRSEKRAQWECRCECGNFFIAPSDRIRDGSKDHCGCLTFERHSIKSTKHGHSRSKNGRSSKTYRAWADMVYRCTNVNSSRWKDYGGRGINVTKRWRKFENFLIDMGEAPPKLTLERKNNDSGYSKRNCMWATYHQQNLNKRSR